MVTKFVLFGQLFVNSYAEFNGNPSSGLGGHTEPNVLILLRKKRLRIATSSLCR